MSGLWKEPLDNMKRKTSIRACFDLGQGLEVGLQCNTATLHSPEVTKKKKQPDDHDMGDEILERVGQMGKAAFRLVVPSFRADVGQRAIRSSLRLRVFRQSLCINIHIDRTPFHVLLKSDP